MNTGYYPGCSLLGTAREYDLSLRALFERLELPLREMEDWICCGASSGHATDHLLSVALPAQNISLAEAQGFEEILAPCAACYNRLRTAQSEMERNPALREKIDELLEPKSDLRLPVRHLLDILHRVPADQLRAKKAIDLSGFRFACYYGCLLTRPGEINTLDDAEQPRDMERLLETLGAKTVSWNFATECCGGAHSIPHREIVTELAGAILANASAHGADAVVTLCPMCHSNLDMRQAGIRGENPAQKAMPIFYLTELLGIALGIAPDALGVDLHFVDPSALFARKAGEVAA